jgi:hypothetical protein
VPARLHVAPNEDKEAELRGAGRRLGLALAMQREGTALMRENLRRRHPDASEAEVDALLVAWLRERPPDAPGRRIAWPRRRPRAV